MATGILESRVDLAIAVLDAFYGRDWPFRLNLRTLDLASSELCVLGQLEGSYGRGVNHIVPLQIDVPVVTTANSTTLNGVFAEALGFHGSSEQYSALTRVWKRTVRRLKNERRKR